MPVGELAALVTAVCWTGTSTLFTLAGQSVGSMVVNRTRLLLAVLFLMVTHWLVYRQLLPLQATPGQWGWLALSSFIGLVLGDAMLFQAFIWIGPRLSMLMMSLAPIVAALFAWLFLSETLAGWEIAGLLMTVGGIAWVILGREGQRNRTPGDKNYLLGLLLGFGAATSQALGLILAKKGLGPDFPALSGNLIRMLVAAGVIWAFTLMRGQAGITVQRLTEQRPALLQIIGGSVIGPFLGVWLSLVAVQLTEVGVASTIMALPPVFLLPVGYIVFRERLGWQSIVGTVVAIVGVAVLFLA